MRTAAIKPIQKLSVKVLFLMINGEISQFPTNRPRLKKSE